MNLGKLVGVATAALVVVFLVAGAISQDDKSGRDSKKAGAENKKAQVAGHGNPAKGAKIFQANCEICHEAASQAVKVGPGLKGLFKRPPHKLSDGKEHRHTEVAIRALIAEGTSAMPPMKAILSPEQRDDVLAYLHTL